MGDLIIEGKIVNHDVTSYSQALVDTERGVIKKVGLEIGKADFKTDALIFPGFVDIHVHCREDATQKQNYKEDFYSVSKAAINGGVTAIVDMPNNPSPPVDEAGYIEKKELTKKSQVPILLYAGIGQNTFPLKQNVPYKVFMGQSVGDLFFDSNESLDSAMKRYSGKQVSFHCEDEEVLIENKNASTHELSRPRHAEIKAIEFAIKLIKKYNLYGNICHCSTLEGLELIRQAKKDGVNVTCEATPHHMFFDESMRNDNLLKMNPPLRKRKDCDALILGLRNGDIDFLATDHAPHLLQEKETGLSGVPNLDTYSNFAAWLIKEHDFSPEDIARICSYNPGRFLNKFTDKKYGMIKEGYVADFTILDINKTKVISKENIKSKCNWSPFEGKVMPGGLEAVFVGGKKF